MYMRPKHFIYGDVSTSLITLHTIKAYGETSIVACSTNVGTRQSSRSGRLTAGKKRAWQSSGPQSQFRGFGKEKKNL